MDRVDGESESLMSDKKNTFNKTLQCTLYSTFSGQHQPVYRMKGIFTFSHFTCIAFVREERNFQYFECFQYRYCIAVYILHVQFGWEGQVTKFAIFSFFLLRLRILVFRVSDKEEEKFKLL